MESRASTVSPYPDQSEAPALQASRTLALFALVGLTGLFVVSVLLKPSTGEYFTVCAFKNFTGLPCPGCGLTHSFCALSKGSVAEAFEFNLIGPFLYAVLFLLWVRSVCVLFNTEKAVRVLDGIAERFNVVRAFAYAFVVFGVGRIVYLLIFQPLPFQEAPLSRLIARLFH
jgi:hypothetical protein